MPGILTGSIPVNWPFWSCRGWSGRHLFPSAKLTFSLSGCHKTFHFSYMKLPCRLTLTVTLTKWFDLNTYSNNPNPNPNLNLTLTLNPYFVYESLICQHQFGGWKWVLTGWSWVDIVSNGTMGLLWGTNFALVSCSTS